MRNRQPSSPGKGPPTRNATEVKKARLAALLRQRLAEPGGLSYGQEALWFEQQRAPGCPVYNIAQAVRISTPLDYIAFDQAADALLERHELLRARFPSNAGRPVTVVEPNLSGILKVVSLEDEDEDLLRERVNREVQEPFDLARGPLVRLRLFARGEADHLFLLVIHHTVADGWSVWLLLDELQHLYSAAVAGVPGDLPPVKAGYGEFVRWQKRMVGGADGDKHRAYWNKTLVDKPQALDLPGDKVRPAALTYRGAVERFDLEPGLIRDMRSLAHEEGVTQAAILMAVFQALLYRYTGQPSFLVGTPGAGRSQTRFTGTVGYFVNPLPIRADLDSDLTGRQLVHRVYSRLREALTHQDYPLPMLVQDLELDRDPGRTPFFETVFVFQKSQRQALKPARQARGNGSNLRWGPWEANPYHLERTTSVYDLTLIVTELADQLSGEVEYNRDLFNRETIVRLAGHFRKLLAGLVAEPDRPIGRMPMITEGERRQLVVEWNQTRVDFPQDTLVHREFEAQAAQTPGANAVVSQQGRLSYRELNVKANQLAHYLISLGVKPGDVVGILLPRSLEYLASALAVLKAGGTFLPLDVDLPDERLAYMIEDARSSSVITGGGGFPGGEALGIPVCHLDRAAACTGGFPSDDLDLPISPLQPAYIIYTSGSTGRPKGVAVAHRSVINLVHDLRRRLMVTQEDVWLAISSPGFDATIAEMFVALTAGASVYIVPHGDSTDGYRLVEVLEESKATNYIGVPGFWRLVLDAGWQGGRTLRAVCGGDWLDRRMADQLQKRRVELSNVYGQTETTVIVTFQPVTAGTGAISVGRPMDNSRIYILDREMEPVPVGIPGEIYVGGAGPAQGYVNLPALTASRFVPDPFSEKPGVRLYRSGDLARFRSDGSIDFLGRMDQQIKIRGFRVEPGEIEAILNEHVGVQTAVVLALERDPGDVHLVAYVLPEEGHSPAGDELSAYLSRRLPVYMIPSLFLVLDELPLTVNGKVDRSELPAPTADSWRRTSVYRAPRSDGERMLARIWADVLGLEQVDIDDNFFGLGGHSLLAMRVLAQIEAETNRRLSMAGFLSNPTVRHVASLLIASGEEPVTEDRAIPRRTDGSPGTRYPLTHGQQALWYVDQSDPERARYNLPAAWRISGRLDLKALEKALWTLVSRHDALRARIVVENGEWWELLPPADVVLKRVDLSQVESSRREEMIAGALRRLARQAFDLQNEPPIRAVYLTLDVEEHILVLVIHHIAFDSWSAGILFEELCHLYQAYTGNNSPALAERDLYFGDYAHWQRLRVEAGDLETEASYWREKLAGIPVLDLAHGRPRPVGSQKSAGLAPFAISSELIQRIEQAGQAQSASLFATLMAVFQVWIYRHTMQRDFGVGFPVTGRIRPETGRLIGYFINLLVLRADVDPGLPFPVFLRQVRRGLLDAMDHQELPFEKVVEAVRPDRIAGQNPLFQVLFTLEHGPPPPLVLGESEARSIQDLELGVQFDLVMTVRWLSEGAQGEVMYDRQLFEADEIERMIERFLTLLRSLSVRPDQPVGQAKVLPEGERQKLLVDWLQTQTNYPRHLCIHQLFEEQVAQNPAAPAVVFEDQRWSYERLNSRANQIACSLRDMDLKPGDIVGVCLTRSNELLAILLAIFKAGGVYLPLNPGLPEARLRYMVENAGAKLIVGEKASRSCFSGDDLNLIELEKLVAGLPAYPGANLDSAIDPAHPAYVVYTSGSTGRPKGVMVCHRSVVNILVDKIRRTDAGAGDVMVAHISIDFEPSLVPLLTPLFFGGTSFIVDEETEADSQRLAEALEDGGVTLMNATPPRFSMLLASGWKGSSGLRLFCGGEALRRQMAEQLLDRSAKLINAYGPTETTIMCTAQEIRSASELITIGRPVSNTRVYILGSQMEVAPIGVPGELFVGGDGLAYGYINQARLTAERFLPDPFGEEPGARLYRTGDQAYFRPDGTIEFLGRLDQQVKIQGNRVELGEIEGLLNDHHQVRQAVVVAREASPADLRLAAYVVPKKGQAVETRELLSYLEQHLPQYMVPSAIILMNEFPMLPSAKVDQTALPEPVWGSARRQTPSKSFTNEHERKLMAIWTDLLKVPEIGPHDNFFDLGGHSLLAVRLMNLIEREFGRRLPLATLLEEATISHLADVLLDYGSKVQLPLLVPLREEGNIRPLFVVTAGYGDLLALGHVAGHLEEGRPVYGLQPPSEEGQPDPDPSLAGLIDDYIEAIRGRQPVGPYLLSGYCSGGLIALALAQRLISEGETVERLLLMESPKGYSSFQHAIFNLLRPFVARFLPEESEERRRPVRILASLFADDGLLAHLNAIRGYKVDKYPAKITLIMAYWSHVRLMAGTWRWKNIAKGGLETVIVPGYHDTFIRDQRAKSFASRLDAVLSRN